MTYADGTQPTVDQMAKDVAAFLVWTAEPNLESRQRPGFAVAIFLLFATILGYLAYQQIWHDAKRAVRVTGAARSREPGEEPPREGEAGRRRLRPPSARNAEPAVQLSRNVAKRTRFRSALPLVIRQV